MIIVGNWDEHAGKAVIEEHGNIFNINLYEGNCFLIGVYEYEDEKGDTREQLMWFFCDENHARIMLGLKKGNDGVKENRLGEDYFRHVTLYRDRCRNIGKIARLFAEACNITIEIAEKEEC